MNESLKNCFSLSETNNDSEDQNLIFNNKTLKEKSVDDAIKCFLRLKPLEDKNQQILYKFELEGQKCSLIASKDNLEKASKYTFDKIFDENSTQEEIFKYVCLPAINGIFENQKSALIFAHGITNSGKTHTVIGTHEDPGIIYLSIKYIFDKINGSENNRTENKDKNINGNLSQENKNSQEIEKIETHKNPSKLIDDVKIYVNFFEIYNDEVYDLLYCENNYQKNENSSTYLNKNLSKHSSKYTPNQTPKNLQFRSNNLEFQNGKKRVCVKERGKLFYIPDITEREITCLQDFSLYFNLGVSKTVHASTNLNSNSSRSHSLFKIILRFDKTNNNFLNTNISKNNVSNLNNSYNNSSFLFKTKANENYNFNSNKNNLIETPNCNGNTIEYSLTIVDLAGNERTNESQVTDINLKETCKINQSLSLLSNCLNTMNQNMKKKINKNFISFRGCNLTKVLSQNFISDQYICMIATMNPSLSDFDSTKYILDFAGLTANINLKKCIGPNNELSNHKLLNNQYFSNGRPNPNYNTNPIKRFECGNLLEKSSSDFYVNDTDKEKNNLCNLTENTDDEYKKTAVKIFNRNLNNIALKESSRENLQKESQSQKDELIEQLQEKLQQEKLKNSNLLKQNIHLQTKEIDNNIQNVENIAIVIEDTEMYYSNQIKELREKLDKAKNRDGTKTYNQFFLNSTDEPRLLISSKKQKRQISIKNPFYKPPQSIINPLLNLHKISTHNNFEINEDLKTPPEKINIFLNLNTSGTDELMRNSIGKINTIQEESIQSFYSTEKDLINYNEIRKNNNLDTKETNIIVLDIKNNLENVINEDNLISYSVIKKHSETKEINENLNIEVIQESNSKTSEDKMEKENDDLINNSINEKSKSEVKNYFPINSYKKNHSNETHNEDFKEILKTDKQIKKYNENLNSPNFQQINYINNSETKLNRENIVTTIQNQENTNTNNLIIETINNEDIRQKLVYSEKIELNNQNKEITENLENENLHNRFDYLNKSDSPINPELQIKKSIDMMDICDNKIHEEDKLDTMDVCNNNNIYINNDFNATEAQNIEEKYIPLEKKMKETLLSNGRTLNSDLKINENQNFEKDRIRTISKFSQKSLKDLNECHIVTKYENNINLHEHSEVIFNAKHEDNNLVKTITHNGGINNSENKNDYYIENETSHKISSKLNSQMKINKIYKDENIFKSYQAIEIKESSQNRNSLENKKVVESAKEFNSDKEEVRKENKKKKSKNNTKKQKIETASNHSLLDEHEENNEIIIKEQSIENNFNSKDIKKEKNKDLKITIKNKKKTNQKIKSSKEMVEEEEETSNIQSKIDLESKKDGKITEKKNSIYSIESEKPKKDKKNKVKNKKNTKLNNRSEDYDSQEEIMDKKGKKKISDIYSNEENQSEKNISSDELDKYKKTKTKNKKNNQKSKKQGTKRKSHSKNKILYESEEEKSEIENDLYVTKQNEKSKANKKNKIKKKGTKKIIEEVSENSEEDKNGKEGHENSEEETKIQIDSDDEEEINNFPKNKKKNDAITKKKKTKKTKKK